MRRVQSVRIAWLVCRAFMALVRTQQPLPDPRMLRIAMQSVGGVWTKLGQYMALRNDVLPQYYCDEFSLLLSTSSPVAVFDAPSIVEREIGRPISEIFLHFERQPLAAASIAQVHRAQLVTGEVVAVKVKHPRADKDFQSDLLFLQKIAALLDWFGLASPNSLVDFVDEFANWTRAELDLIKEARNAQLLRTSAYGEKGEVYPSVHRALSTSHCIVYEFISGISMLDLIRLSASPGGQIEIARRGLSPKALAARLAWAGLNQIYLAGVFHADPHPANLIALPGNRIAFVDFGIIGHIDSGTRRRLARYAFLLFSSRFHEAADCLLAFATPSSETNLSLVRRDLVDSLSQYVIGMRQGGNAHLTEVRGMNSKY